MWRFFVLPLPIVMVVVILTLAGCAGEPGQDENRANAPPPNQPAIVKADDGRQAGDEQQAAGESGPAIKLRTADRQVYDVLLSQHQGKVVLVDFWATWCLSCMEQFPHTVQLHEKYASQGLAVISVGLDDPDGETAIKEFLATHRAVFDNLLSKWGSNAQSFETFDIDAGTLPHYKLYDHNGNLRETFSVDPSADKQYTLEDIEQSIKKLLAQRDAA